MGSEARAVELEEDPETLVQEILEDIEGLITFEAIIARDQQELDDLFRGGSLPSLDA